MKNSEQTRRDVSADYAKALKSQGSGCCGGPLPKGDVARIAGYIDADFATLPTEAVVNSFGCGNPLAFSEVQPGQVVLDLGSGAGIDLLLAAKKSRRQWQSDRRGHDRRDDCQGQGEYRGRGYHQRRGA